MSVEVMAWVWNQPMSPNCKIVLLAIADHADPYGGSAFPSQATLARKTGYTPRQIRRIVDELVALNVLHVSEYAGGRYGTARNRRSHLYRVLIPRAVNMSALEQDEVIHRADKCDSSGRTRVSAKSSVEPPTSTSPSDLRAVIPESDEELSYAGYFKAHPDEHPRVARWLNRRDSS